MKSKACVRNKPGRILPAAGSLRDVLQEGGSGLRNVGQGMEARVRGGGFTREVQGEKARTPRERL